MSTSVSQFDPSPSSNPIAAEKKSSNRSAKALIIAAAAVLVVLVALFVIRIQGFVGGSEFSPTHFQQRDFQFYEIPLIHQQITPIRRSISTPATANYLRQKSLIKTPKGQPVDWHLVSISRGLGGVAEADAQLLIDQLQLNSNNQLYWRTWTVDHPDLAGRFWPVIQRLAERELYVLMPRLFEIAQNAQTPTDLRSSVDAYLVTQYQSLIQDMIDAGRIDVAEQLAAEAGRDYPGAANWSSILVESSP